MRKLLQQDIDILKQSEKKISLELYLLNENMKTIDSLHVALIDGSLSMDATADIRSTCSFTFFVRDSSYLTNPKSKIWLDKYVRISVSIFSQRTQMELIYPLGIFMFNENSYQYDISTRTLNVSCIDCMGKLTGIRNGQVGAFLTKIPSGTNIRNSMISVVSQLGFIKKYLIEEIGAEFGDVNDIYTDLKYNQVPYDLQFSSGTTVYNIISELRDLYSGYETFFDIDGTFVCQKIPNGTDSAVVLDNFILRDLIISESRNNSFEKVKNVTELWGKCIEVDRYSDTCSLVESQYNVKLGSLDSLINYTVFGITIDKPNLNNPTIKINDFEAFPVVNSDAIPVESEAFTKNTLYAFKYLNSKFYFLGEPQIHAIYKDENPESPFNVNELGEILDVKTGGDYDNIYSNDLALQRAKYENWLTTRLQDSVTLTTLIIPWLQVNQKISYQSKITGKDEEYIIKSISMAFKDGTMSIQAIKFYPLYPTIL